MCVLNGCLCLSPPTTSGSGNCTPRPVLAVVRPQSRAASVCRPQILQRDSQIHLLLGLLMWPTTRKRRPRALRATSCTAPALLGPIRGPRRAHACGASCAALRPLRVALAGHKACPDLVNRTCPCSGDMRATCRHRISIMCKDARRMNRRWREVTPCDRSASDGGFCSWRGSSSTGLVPGSPSSRRRAA